MNLTFTSTSSAVVRTSYITTSTRSSSLMGRIAVFHPFCLGIGRKNPPGRCSRLCHRSQNMSFAVVVARHGAAHLVTATFGQQPN